MILYIILGVMGIFTVWNIIYTHNVKQSHYKMMNNIDNLNKKDGTTNKKG